MAEFTLACESKDLQLEFPVTISEFENGTEQRRLIHDGIVGTVSLQSPLVTRDGLDAYINFYNTQNGTLDAFTWDSDFDSNSYNCRFAGPIVVNFARGTYRASFEFKLLSVA